VKRIAGWDHAVTGLEKTTLTGWASRVIDGDVATGVAMLRKTEALRKEGL
jgi:hypothetical protein